MTPWISTERPGVPLAWLLHTPLEIQLGDDRAFAGAEGGAGMLIVPDSSTVANGTFGLGEGYGTVPVSYPEDYKPADAWRADVPYLRINSKTDGDLGGQTYGVLLVPFNEKPPEVEVSVRQNANTTRLQMHEVSIQWPDQTDVLSVDYRSPEPTCELVRKGEGARALWSETARDRP